jgi:hypothetical protein
MNAPFADEARMNRVLRLAVFASAIGCASAPAPAVPPAPAVNLYARIPSEIGAFKLTERGIVRGLPTDSLFRFSDGSRTILTVIIYDVAADVKVDADSQKWTPREGEKFKLVQAIRRDRGQLSDFTLAFSDTTRFAVGARHVLEHAIAMPTRYPSGMITVEMQYLYLIGGKFLKVRATIPQQGWEETKVPSFARELAIRMAH